jgi:hypothetical protein
MGYSKLRTKNISSDKITINVRSLPADGAPKYFTGLVGKTDFQFQINKQKFLVNEPVEAKLVVKGSGAMENFEAPKIFTNPELEEFESNGELKINRDFTATKTFNYTYLARGGFKREQTDLPLAYFDPETRQYVTKTITIPPIEVAGGTYVPPKKIATGKEGGSDNKNTPEQQESVVDPEALASGLVSPVFGYSSLTGNWFKIVNYTLGGILFIMLFLWIQKNVNFKISVDPNKKKVEQMKKSGINYSELFHLLSNIGSGKSDDVNHIVTSSKLSDGAKKYFLSSLQVCEKRQFSNEKIAERVTFNPKYFNELLDLLKADTSNENIEEYSGPSGFEEV